MEFKDLPNRLLPNLVLAMVLAISLAIFTACIYAKISTIVEYYANGTDGTEAVATENGDHHVDDEYYYVVLDTVHESEL